MKILTNLLWAIVAQIVAIPFVADWIIARAQRTPYFHLPGYMERWWFFNRYDATDKGRRYRWLPSIRVHHILRADLDRNLHDHPWNARTILLRGGYVETRLSNDVHVRHWRGAGDTAQLRFGEFHKIDWVSPGGVWTLFLTWDYQGTWGFLVGDFKVPHREYDRRVKAGECLRPPTGWWCSREPGHDGPCAAHRIVTPRTQP